MYMKIIRYLIDIYRKLPIKPFPRIVSELYRRYKLHNPNKIVMAKIDGIKYQLDLNELIDSSIYYTGCFEPFTTAVIKKFIKPGMTVFDIGANIGCHTLLFAKLVRSVGRVIAFEPMSWAYSKLKHNIELNNFDNIFIEQIALSNVNQRVQNIYFRSSWVLSRGSSSSSKKEENVDFIMLDEYVESNKINRIDFVKIDVDGYEYKVIQGARNTLKRDKPLVLIELGNYTLQNVGDNIYDLVAALTDIGYQFYSERDLSKFSDNNTMIESIPKDGTINVLLRA